MVMLYKAQFFYPFKIQQGSFDALKKAINKKREWQHYRVEEPIEEKNPATYAEFKYFHPHARQLLFGEGDKASLIALQYRQEEIDKGWTVSVEWNLSEKEQTEKDKTTIVTIKLDWVSVMVYDLDIAILSLGVSWDKNDTEKINALRLSKEFTLGDCLNINNLLRKTLPSFFDYTKIESFRKSASKENYQWTEKQKSLNELPLKITLNSPNRLEIKEDFGDAFNLFLNEAEKNHSYTAKHFGYWLEKLAEDLKADVEEECKKSRKEIIKFDVDSWEPILDERNFVTSFVIADADETKKQSVSCNNIVEYNNNMFGRLDNENKAFREILYQYFYVEPSNNSYVQNNYICDTLIAKAAYLRYKGYGTYYGFTRYSGMYLFHAFDKDEFPRNVISNHFDSMYYQFANLLLCMRAALLDISDRCAKVSNEIKCADDFERVEIVTKIEQLRTDFLKFNNKYWFCEITAQEQGIEMFDLWNENMGNKRLFEEVEAEVNALHEFGTMQMSSRINLLAYINIAALSVAFLSLLASALSLSPSKDFWFYALIAIAAAIFIGGGAICWSFTNAFSIKESIIRKVEKSFKSGCEPK